MRDTLKQDLDHAIGIDIGGTKVKIAILTTQGKILWSRKVPVEKKNTELFILQLFKLCQEALLKVSASCCRGIGIAIPAVIADDNNTIILSPNLPFLDGCQLKSLIADKFAGEIQANIPVVLGFDGTASVIAEAWQGEGRNSQNIATIAVGTGIGGGLMLGGKIIKGYNNVAGAIGWSRLGTAENVPSLEDICAGPGISREGRSVYQEIYGNNKEEIEKKQIVRSLFDAAEEGEEKALSFLQLVIRHVGVAAANLVSLVNPEVIVFAGSVGLRFEPYLKDIKEIIVQLAQPIAGRAVKLRCSKLGDNAVVTGAAGLILFAKNLNQRS